MRAAAVACGDVASRRWSSEGGALAADGVPPGDGAVLGLAVVAELEHLAEDGDAAWTSPTTTVGSGVGREPSTATAPARPAWPA